MQTAMAEVDQKVAKLESDVRHLEADVSEIKTDVKAILAIVNQGRGALWLAGIVGTGGGFMGAFLKAWLVKGGP
jgi:hypothetical protein